QDPEDRAPPRAAPRERPDEPRARRRRALESGASPAGERSPRHGGRLRRPRQAERAARRRRERDPRPPLEGRDAPRARTRLREEPLLSGASGPLPRMDATLDARSSSRWYRFHFRLHRWASLVATLPFL